MDHWDVIVVGAGNAAFCAALAAQEKGASVRISDDGWVMLQQHLSQIP